MLHLTCSGGQGAARRRHRCALLLPPRRLAERVAAPPGRAHLCVPGGHPAHAPHPQVWRGCVLAFSAWCSIAKPPAADSRLPAPAWCSAHCPGPGRRAVVRAEPGARRRRGPRPGLPGQPAERWQAAPRHGAPGVFGGGQQQRRAGCCGRGRRCGAALWRERQLGWRRRRRRAGGQRAQRARHGRHLRRPAVAVAAAAADGGAAERQAKGAAALPQARAAGWVGCELYWLPSWCAAAAGCAHPAPCRPPQACCTRCRSPRRASAWGPSRCRCRARRARWCPWLWGPPPARWSWPRCSRGRRCRCTWPSAPRWRCTRHPCRWAAAVGAAAAAC